MSIDELIRQLEAAREQFGGHSHICIRDADTAWHLNVVEIRQSNTEPGRVLIIPSDYSDTAN